MRIFPLFCANLSRIYNKKFSKYRIYCFAKKFGLFGKIVAFCSSQNSASFLLPFKKFIFSKKCEILQKKIWISCFAKMFTIFRKIYAFFVFTKFRVVLPFTRFIFPKKIAIFLYPKFQIIDLRRMQYKKPRLVAHTLYIYSIMIQRIIVSKVDLNMHDIRLGRIYFHSSLLIYTKKILLMELLLLRSITKKH